MALNFTATVAVFALLTFETFNELLGTAYAWAIVGVVL